MTNAKGTVFPNLYMLMVGPPGTGKTDIIKHIRPFLLEVGAPLCAEHISKAALIDELVDGRVAKQIGAIPYIYNATHVVSAEYVETFPEYEPALFSMLADWWDCPKQIRERKRHLKEPIVIKDTYCGMFTGVQPGMMSEVFPASAWAGGLLARTIFIYVQHKVEFALRGPNAIKTHYGRALPPATHDALVRDLKLVSDMHGPFGEDESFLAEYLRWHEGKQQPAPRHPRLFYYNGRREHNLEKLSMISAASRGSKILTGYDYLRARGWMESCEEVVEDIFIEMHAGEDMVLMKDLHAFLWTVGKGKPVRESVLRRWLAGRISSQRVEQFLAAAYTAGYFTFEEVPPGSGVRLFAPADLDEYTPAGR